MTRRVTAATFVVAMMAWLAACGGDDPVGPDPAVEPFVGTWDADVLTITNGVITADILASGGSFFITVEPSGHYTATLVAFGSPYVEQGQLEVLSSSTFRQTPTLPAGPSVTSTYMFATPDSLILDGETEFDINQDGDSEEVDVHFELSRR